MEGEGHSGLVRLERCLRERLGSQPSGRVVFRWARDGHPFLRLRVAYANEAMHYLWLEDEDPTRIRKELDGLAELEELIKRQLVEPGGEELFIYWQDEPFPIAQCRAIIRAGDRLDIMWEDG